MSRWLRILWNDEPGENVDKVQARGFTLEDIEAVISEPVSEDISRSTGRGVLFGYTLTGRFVCVPFEEYEDGDAIYPVTAFEVE